MAPRTMMKNSGQLQERMNHKVKNVMQTLDELLIGQ